MFSPDAPPIGCPRTAPLNTGGGPLDSRAAGGQVTVIESDGTDTLTAVEFLEFSDRTVANRTVPSDFTGDDKSDILWCNGTMGANSMWQMNGSSIAADAGQTSVSTSWSVQAGLGIAA